MTRVKKSLHVATICAFVFSIASCDSSGMNAGELYDACSIFHIPKEDRTNNEKIKFSRCQAFTERIFYDSGYVYIGDEEDPIIQELKNYCPSQWSIQLMNSEGGPYLHLVNYWDDNGMSFFQRNFLDAEEATLDVYKQLFQHCPQKRSEAGIPKVSKY